MSDTLAGVPLVPPHAKDVRLAMLIWGDSGAGKTTLAATAPGKKLFLMFDSDGELSLVGREDVVVMQLSAQQPMSVMTQFKTDNPYGLKGYLEKHPEIETVVVDSMTTLAYMALLEAVRMNKSSTIEQPGMHGYAFRNASLLRATVAMMTVTKALNRHLILTTHEGAADKDQSGAVISVTMALSDSVANQVGIRFNEVWHLSDVGTERRIAVRQCRMRRPMKTRMFDAPQPEFVWKDGGIGDWYHMWQSRDGRKLPLPVTASATLGIGGKK